MAIKLLTEPIKVEAAATCSIDEFGGTNQLDIAEAEISGRYPETGFAVNRESDMVLRVITGIGTLATKDYAHHLHAGVTVLIEKQTPYYYSGERLRILMVSSPPWSAEQYEVTD